MAKNVKYTILMTQICRQKTVSSSDFKEMHHALGGRGEVTHLYCMSSSKLEVKLLRPHVKRLLLSRGDNSPDMDTRWGGGVFGNKGGWVGSYQVYRHINKYWFPSDAQLSNIQRKLGFFFGSTYIYTLLFKMCNKKVHFVEP